MNRGQLKRIIAEKAGISSAQAETCLKTLTDAVIRSISIHKEGGIPGIMSLKVVTRTGRSFRHLKTGKLRQLPPRLAVQAHFTKSFTDQFLPENEGFVEEVEAVLDSLFEEGGEGTDQDRIMIHYRKKRAPEGEG